MGKSKQYSNNNSIQFFIIYVPSQQLQGQLQTHHSVDTITVIIIIQYYDDDNNNNIVVVVGQNNLLI
jgi:hypothetical protein